jgi:hypothetical protein
MGLNQLLDDGQADAGSARLPRTGFLNPVETLENVRKVFFGNTFAAVGEYYLIPPGKRSEDTVTLPPCGVYFRRFPSGYAPPEQLLPVGGNELGVRQTAAQHDILFLKFVDTTPASG